MKIFNTLSGQKEEFQPQGNTVRMYVCGVTPYSDSHIGHAMSYILFDVVRRYLSYRGYQVKHVQNITDIDDKIINRAHQTGVSPNELAEKYSNSFLEDMDALNVQRADVYPRATSEIPKIIEIIEGLIAKNYAYKVTGGDVYFRVTKDSDYGKLGHRTLDSMMAGARIDIGEAKEHPMDFTLWKAAKPGEPSWDSPWGPGRPGWHIECSAMSVKYLGEQIDIHGGGQDLIFPHHENEIAQTEGFTGKKPFVKHWMHNGLLQLSGEKMSKSLGNLITIKDALKKYSADALRIFVLSSSYRSPLTYSEEIVVASERGADRLRQVANSSPNTAGKASSIDVEQYRNSFIAAMDDDFNTAQTVGILFDLARDINRSDDEGTDTIKARQVFREIADMLGLTLKPVQAEPLDVQMLSRVYTSIYQALGRSDIPDEKQGAESLMENLIKLRAELRKAKQFQQADMLRKKLEEAGITLEDTPKGTIWKRKR